MRIISDNNLVDKLKWESIFNLSNFKSPFQSLAYFDFINMVAGMSADVFAIEENDEYTSLVVVTIQKEKGIQSFFSRRGIISGGPLVANNKINSSILLMDFISKYYKRKLIYLEIRNYFDFSSFSQAFFTKNWSFLPYLNFVLSIENKSLNDLLQGMKYNRRREIKLSLDRGVIYKECKSESELLSLYRILKDLYLTRVKLPIPNVDYFLKLWKSSIGKVFIVEHDGKVIGGSFCAFLNKTSIYTMYYCGIRNYDKKIFPTHLGIIAAIEFGINNNCKTLDFMGAGLKGEEYGVRNYKQEFGGELNEFGRYRKVLNPFLFKIGLIGLFFIKKLK